VLWGDGANDGCGEGGCESTIEGDNEGMCIGYVLEIDDDGEGDIWDKFGG
jgi:hypothetical protein